jgi:UPF0148 protein
MRGKPQMEKESKEIQTMANMLRQGATLTDMSCPICASPLFKLRSGEIWCVKCQKRVVIVKEGETPTEATKPILLSQLESTVLTKIQEIEKKLKEEADPAQLEKLTATLSQLLENLEKIKKMKQ